MFEEEDEEQSEFWTGADETEERKTAREIRDAGLDDWRERMELRSHVTRLGIAWRRAWAAHDAKTLMRRAPQAPRPTTEKEPKNVTVINLTSYDSPTPAGRMHQHLTKTEPGFESLSYEEQWKRVFSKNRSNQLEIIRANPGKATLGRVDNTVQARPVASVAIDLSNFVGRTRIEKLMGFVRAEPGGSTRDYDSTFVRACELARTHRITGA